MCARDPDRRQLLLAGLSSVAGLSLFPVPARGAARLLASRPFGSDGSARSVLMIQLSGGNDALSTVVPYADDDYNRARQLSLIKPDEVLKIDDYRGFNPFLEGLRDLYELGHLAIVEGTGYPQPVRSHFKSMEIWHAADMRGRLAGEGWVGRLCGSAWADNHDPSLLVHFGTKVPYSLYSTHHPAIAFEQPSDYRWIGDTRERKSFAQLAAVKGADGGESSLEYLRRVLSSAHESSTAVLQACERYQSTVEYAPGDLNNALWTVAAMSNAKPANRIYSIDYGGFDTHSLQRYRHDRRLRPLDLALDVFMRDMRGTEAGKNLLVLIFSEFGRHLQENGGGGTDHGAGGLMMVAGESVRGGIYGKHPSLEQDDLDQGDPAFTTDFRSVYATIIEKWFGQDHEPVLGAKYPLVSFLGTTQD